MKKIITILALTASAVLVNAQGLVYMYTAANISTNTAVSPLFGGTGIGGVTGRTAASSSGQVFYYALLISTYDGSSPDTDAAGLTSGDWVFSGVTATNYTSAGSIASPNTSGGTATTGWASGVTNYVTIVGWSASLGTTWAAVSNLVATGFAGNTTAGYFGVSTVGYMAAGGGVAPAASVFGGTGVPTGFTLYAVPVPEPSTIALAGLGAASLLLFRRRK